MDRDEWQGLTARTSEGRVRGVVVGMFEGGPLAGWLRVHDDSSGHDPRGLPDSTTVCAIPPWLVRREPDGLVLDATLHRPR